MMAYDKELRPDNRLSQSVYHGASSEGSLSPDTRSVYSKAVCYTTVVCSAILSRIRWFYRMGIVRQNIQCMFKTFFSNLFLKVNDIIDSVMIFFFLSFT